MKLQGKKSLIARTLNIGKGRISFNQQRLSEIKEAITKQDIRDLQSAGAFTIKEKKGRRKIKKRKTRRRAGSIKNKVNTRKKDYVKLTRKLRAYLSNLKQRRQVTGNQRDKCKKSQKFITFKGKSFSSWRRATEGVN